MAVYRCLQAISRGEKRYEIGTVGPFDWLDADSLALLIDRDVLCRVSAPPLSALPGWFERAAKLEPHGIRTAEDVQDASPATIRRALKLPTIVAANKVRREALALLSAAPD